MRHLIDKFFDRLERVHKFATHDIWEIGQPGEAFPDSFLAQQVRVMVLLVQKFIKDALMVRAAALAFATSLALVPLIVFLFIIIQSLNLGEDVYVYLDKQLATALDTLHVPTPVSDDGPVVIEDDEETTGAGDDGAAGEEASDKTAPTDREVLERLLGMVFQGVGQEETAPGSDEALKNPIQLIVDYAEKSATNPGALGLAGLIFLLTTVFGLMRNIEKSFLSIWGTARHRTWFRLFSDYLTVTLILPIVAVGVLGLTAALASERVTLALGPAAVVFQGMRVMIIWGAFAVLYGVVPNAGVRWRYATVGGVVAGTAWLLTTMAYVELSFGLAKYNALYAGFAQFPVLLMWVYFSWVIVLFGAELTYAYQYEKTFALERWADEASFAYREAVGVRTMIEMAWRFDRGLEGLEAQRAAEEWNVPIRLVNEVLEDFEKAGLASACATEPLTYRPGRSLSRINMPEVLLALREAGRDPSAFREDADFKRLISDLSMPDNGAAQATLSDIVQQQRLALPEGGGAEAQGDEG
jgi:membrane protein